MFEPNITKDAINELPLEKYEGEIVVVDKIEDIPKSFEEISRFTEVGFDTETKPVFVKGGYNDVALLQIAIPNKVFLVRISLTGITAEIISFFENESITKLGVGLRDDIIFLQRIQNFAPAGFLELNEMVNEIDIEANGLRKLTAIILGFRISKNAQVSNWEAAELNYKQTRYAATDAWVCLKMYNKLTGLNLFE
ncbi:3'-5' exonuclease domain-containing protein 2 [Crocinitomix sp.]|nr:3'-5' exonuclease domain-containing protein 2 [Crocinitomix sp.]